MSDDIHIPSPPPTLRDLPPQRSRFSQFARRTLQPGARSNVAALSLAFGAGTAAYGIPDPLIRAGALLACSALIYIVGLFQPTPR